MYYPINIERAKKYGNNYWEVFSPKANRIVRCYSDLEYEHYILVETNPNIIAFCEKPLKISYNLNGINIESLIDMWVKYKDGTEYFIKAKYSSELDPSNPKSERSIRQTKSQQLWCNENGFNYEIKTEIHIRDNPLYIANMKTILSYVKRNLHPIETDILYIKKAIYEENLTINQIKALLPEIPLERIKQSIAFMIYMGMAVANVGIIEFGIQTEVRLNA